MQSKADNSFVIYDEDTAAARLSIDGAGGVYIEKSLGIGATSISTLR